MVTEPVKAGIVGRKHTLEVFEGKPLSLGFSGRFRHGPYSQGKYYWNTYLLSRDNYQVGAWEHGAFIGCIVFAQGNNQHHGKAFGLTLFQVCELVRVALREHEAAVSRIVALALAFLKRYCEGIRLVVSYADPEHGHVGGIYQAGNWVYVGTGGSSDAFYDAAGKRLHSRAYSPTGAKIQVGQFAQVAPTGSIRRVTVSAKHKYFMPLDAEIRAKVAPLARPYPKRVRSAEIGTEAPTSGGGEIPTRTLQQVAG